MVELDQLNIHSSREIIARHGLTLPELFDLSLEFYKEEQHQFHLTYEQKNQLAAYFRQSTLGPYRPEKLNPGYFDFVGNDRKKAWEALGEISSNGAMAGFCNLLETVCPDLVPWIRHKKRERENKKKEEKALEDQKKKAEEARQFEASKLINIVKMAEELKIQQSVTETEQSEDDDEEMPVLERNDRSVSAGGHSMTVPSSKQCHGHCSHSVNTPASSNEPTIGEKLTCDTENYHKTDSIIPEPAVSHSSVPEYQANGVFLSDNAKESPPVSVSSPSMPIPEDSIHNGEGLTNGDFEPINGDRTDGLDSVNGFIETISESGSSSKLDRHVADDLSVSEAPQNVTDDAPESEESSSKIEESPSNIVSGSSSVGPEALNAVLRQHFACMLYLKQMRDSGHTLTAEQEAYLTQMAPYESHINSLKSRVDQAVEEETRVLSGRQTPVETPMKTVSETQAEAETETVIRAATEIVTESENVTEPADSMNAVITDELESVSAMPDITPQNDVAEDEVCPEVRAVPEGVELDSVAKITVEQVSVELPEETLSQKQIPVDSEADIPVTSQESFAVVDSEPSLEVIKPDDAMPEIQGGLVGSSAELILEAEIQSAESQIEISAPPLPSTGNNSMGSPKSDNADKSTELEDAEARVAEAESHRVSELEIAVDPLNDVEVMEKESLEPVPKETVTQEEVSPGDNESPTVDSSEDLPIPESPSDQETLHTAAVAHPAEKEIIAHAVDSITPQGIDIEGQVNEAITPQEMVIEDSDEHLPCNGSSEPNMTEYHDDEVKVWNKDEVAQFIMEVSQDPDSVLTVGRGETVTVRIPTYESGTALYWEFATDNYDIGFGASFEWEEKEGVLLSDEGGVSTPEKTPKTTQNSSPEKEEIRVLRQSILPILRRSSHERVITGSHAFPRSGTYLLMFDNSYSLLRSKTVFYRVFYTR